MSPVINLQPAAMQKNVKIPPRMIAKKISSTLSLLEMIRMMSWPFYRKTSILENPWLVISIF